MGEQRQDPEDYRPGDKVRIRTGPYAGARGIIRLEKDGLFEIKLDDSESNIVTVPVENITNYSRAARRAWKVMPKRAGRPSLPFPRKKMVSIRIDVDVWNRLDEAIELGLIPSREQAINSWLRDRLSLLFDDNHPQT
jgi:hypothetical protein